MSLNVVLTDGRALWEYAGIPVLERWPRVSSRLAACLAMTVMAPAACSPPGFEEVIVFSRPDPGVNLRRHLWSIRPDGDPGTLQQITSGEVVDTTPAISPDGTMLAFGRSLGGKDAGTTLVIRSLVSGQEVTVPRDADPDWVDTSPFWAPGSRLLGFTRQLRSRPGRDGAGSSRTWTVPIMVLPTGIRAGRPGQLTSEAPVGNYGASWRPSGADILFNKEIGLGGPVALWRLTYPELIESEVIPAGCCGTYAPGYSPDGHRIGFIVNDARQQMHVSVAHLDGSGVTRVTCDLGWARFSWSPDGKDMVLEPSGRPPGLWRVTVPPIGGPCGTPTLLTREPLGVYESVWGRVVRAR